MKHGISRMLWLKTYQARCCGLCVGVSARGWESPGRRLCPCVPQGIWPCRGRSVAIALSMGNRAQSRDSQPGRLQHDTTRHERRRPYMVQSRERIFRMPSPRSGINRFNITPKGSSCHAAPARTLPGRTKSIKIPVHANTQQTTENGVSHMPHA